MKFQCNQCHRTKSKYLSTNQNYLFGTDCVKGVVEYVCTPSMNEIHTLGITLLGIQVSSSQSPWHLYWSVDKKDWKAQVPMHSPVKFH